MGMLARNWDRQMHFASGYRTAEAQLLVTLSGFAYLDSTPLPGETVAAQESRMRQDIDAALAASNYASWRVVWGPGLSGDRANILYPPGDRSRNPPPLPIPAPAWPSSLNSL